VQERTAFPTSLAASNGLLEAAMHATGPLADVDDTISQRRSMAAYLGLTEDDPIAGDLHAAGFRLSSIPLLELVPLVEMAWAAGTVSSYAGRVITGAAARRKAIRDGAYSQLQTWLTFRPADEVFRVARRALRHRLESIDRTLAAATRSSLLSESMLLACPDGGLLGGDAVVDPGQRRWLDDLAKDLGGEGN
jgi:hypothetical protein